MSDNILTVNNLCSSFFTSAGEVKAVNNISFTVKKGEVLGIAGESGSGKSTIMLAVMGLNKIKSGSVIFNDKNINDYDINEIRGKNISMIFQDPMTSLNPVLTIGYQMRETLKRHKWQGNINSRITEMLERVGITPAEKRISQYPHEFSGGQRQRIMIAMSLLCKPDLLIADEPTTALDVTVQAEILKLLKDLQHESKMSVILITHDLGVIAGEADRVLIMYGGHIFEQGTRREIFYQPSHPYTQGVLNSVPNPDNIKQKLTPIEGQPPDLLNPPKGCPYVKRCNHAMRVCLEKFPVNNILSETHNYNCWLGVKK
ncbi:MAG: ABC transporter ATP-binding protein [Synergistaceae bacterium]|nr:ABC transporter ATP-binding protein [Synergistaceae bacterium]